MWEGKNGSEGRNEWRDEGGGRRGQTYNKRAMWGINQGRGHANRFSEWEQIKPDAAASSGSCVSSVAVAAEADVSWFGFLSHTDK